MNNKQQTNKESKMKTYEVTYYRIYTVDAENEESAKELAHEDAKFDFDNEAKGVDRIVTEPYETIVIK